MDDFNFRVDYTEDSLYQILRKMPLKFAAGEKSVYSNMGYVTLGLIMSKVTGKFYGDFLQERSDQEQPGQRRVGQQQRPVPDAQSLGDVGVPHVQRRRSQLGNAVVPRHEPPRPRPGQDERVSVTSGIEPGEQVLRKALAPAPVPAS